jgi:hypothetical protein
MKARIFRFVRHENAQSYLDLGWIAHDGLKGTHHGQFSTIIEWPGEEPPSEPKEIPLAS